MANNLSSYTDTIENVRFASDLGWEPGYWPITPTVDGTVYRRGQMVVDGEGDVQFVIYTHYDGYIAAATMKVFND